MEVWVVIGFIMKNGITQINVSRANIMNNQLQVSYFEGNAEGYGSFYLHSRFSQAEMGSGDICELLIFNRLPKSAGA